MLGGSVHGNLGCVAHMLAVEAKIRRANIGFLLFSFVYAGALRSGGVFLFNNIEVTKQCDGKCAVPVAVASQYFLRVPLQCEIEVQRQHGGWGIRY